MSKPTLIQRLLNQPSQKYADLPQRQRKDYFSSAGSMRRIAASEAFQTEQIRTHSHLGDPPSPSLVDDTRRPIALSSDFTLRIHKKATMATTSGTTSKAPTANGHPASTSSSGRQRDSLPPRSRAGLGATKMTSPPSISSVVTARTSSSGPGGRSTQPRAPQLQQNPKRHSSQSQRNSRQRQLIISDDDSDDLDGFDSSGDDEFDIFFTPNQTPRTSMASSSIAFPSKRGSVGSSLQPRKASRKSLRSPTPTQITPTNSNSPSIPGGIQNGHVVQSQPSQPPAQAQNHAQNQPRVDQHLPKQQPLGSSASASALLQQQHQRVASVNRKVSNPIPSSGVYPSSHQRRASGPDAPLQRQRRPSIPSAPPQTQSQQRKPSVPSTTTTPTQLDQLTAQQQQLANSTGSSTRTHSRTPSAATNIKGASTPSTSASLSRASSLNQKPPSGSSSRTPQPPLLHHPDSVPITKPHPNPTRITSTAPSNFSLSSTSLENHSDIFTASGRGSEEGLTDSTAMTSPVNSDGRGHKGKSSKSKATRSTRLPASYHTFSGATVQPQHRRANSASNAPELPQRDYSYTEDDWAKDVKWLVGSIVTGSSENVNGSAMPNGKTDLKRSGSSTSKRESERSSLGLGRPLSLTGKSKAKDEEGSVDKGKGKAREDDGKDDADGKKKKRKSGKVERDVVYYTATNGMPRPPPPSDFQGNGAAVGSSSAHPIQLPYQLGPVLEEEEGLGLRDNRLSVVLEGEEEPLTPKLPNGNLTPVRNSIATKSSGTKPDGIKRRKSRSIGDADFENSMVIVEKPDAQIQEEELPRQTSVVSWADDYKSILARTKAGKGNLSPSSAYTSSYLSNPSTSQSSFAYHNAIPVSNGELPSHGTPGFTSLHLPRAPQSIFAKDSPGWKSLLSNNSGHPQTMIPPMQQGASPLSGKVDLTRGGIAQTTMTSVEVVRGIAGVGVGGGSNKKGFRGMLSNLGRRRTVSGGEAQEILDRQKKGVLGRGLSFSGRLRKRSEDIYGTMRAGKLSIGSMAEDPREQAMATISAERVLGFTGYRRPPTHVPSGSVLVQVWAVAVDGVDGKLVGLRLGTAKPRKEDQQVLEGAPLVDEPEDEERWRGEQTEGEETEREDMGRTRRGSGLGRKMSLRERLGSLSRRKTRKKEKEREQDATGTDNEGSGPTVLKRKNTLRGRRKDAEKDKALPPPPILQPEVGFIPGRSFVGRVLECGWEVKEEVIRKGEWVVGLLEPKKSGALTEFIVVDRRRIKRVPHPASVPGEEAASGTATTTSFNSFSSGSTTKPPRMPQSSLTLEELALLPLCGLPAYRAVRTFMRAFSGLANMPLSPRAYDYPTFASAMSNGTFLGGHHHLHADHEPHRKRRALVLRGHDGVGAMVVQMLALRGWRVSVHVPIPGPQDQEDVQRYMLESEARVLHLGGEEVVFDDGGNTADPWWDEGRGAAVRVLEWLREDGDVFDAVLDTIGGKEVREAAERLLRSVGRDDGEEDPTGKGAKKTGAGQFTTLVGDVPERTIPTAADNFRAGLRSLKFGTGGGSPQSEAGATATPSEETRSKVGYAWISVTQDVDWEGEDIPETLTNVLRLAVEHGIRPIVPRISVGGESTAMYTWKGGVIPFERTPEIFVDGDGPLCNGGTMVAKVAG